MLAYATGAASQARDGLDVVLPSGDRDREGNTRSYASRRVGWDSEVHATLSEAFAMLLELRSCPYEVTAESLPTESMRLACVRNCFAGLAPPKSPLPLFFVLHPGQGHPLKGVP